MAIYYSVSTKGFYNTDAIAYPTLPEDKVLITESEYQTLLNAVNKDNREIILVDGKLQLQEKTLSWDDLRPKRNGLLTSSDHTQLADYPGDKTAWATYRQALRDLPLTYPNPKDVVWPTAPV